MTNGMRRNGMTNGGIRIMISLILFKQYKVRSFVHLDHRGIVLRFQTETERVCMS